MKSFAAFVSVVVAVLVGASPALAQNEAFEVALEADGINQEHCADLYTSQVGQAATATLAVAEVWQRVDQVYNQTQAPYLLFWRGVLAQCLGRDEAALVDLEAFVEQQSESSMFSDLVRQAKTRLRRLSGGGPVGQGPSAAWLRQGARLEIETAYGAGGGVQELACVDPQTGGAVLNSVCLGGQAAAGAYAGLFSPVGARVRLDVFPARALGLGARVSVDWSTPTGLPTARDPGATVMIAAGPQLRVLNSVASGGRAGWLRLEVRFAAAFGNISPWAGSKYRSMGFLDAGTWALRHVGPAAWVSGGFEISPKLALEVGGWFAWYVPMPGTASSQVVEGSEVQLRYLTTQPVDDPDSEPTRGESVEILPDVEQTSRMGWGGRLALLAPIGKGVAIGPFIGVDVHTSTIRFPNSESDVWPRSVVDAQGQTLACDQQLLPETEDGDDNCRKVYSTRRLDLVGRIGIEVRFGVGSTE